MKTVLVTEPIHADGLARLRAAPGLDVIEGWTLPPDSLAAAVASAHAIATRTMPMPASLLATSNRLEVMCKHGVGCDHIDVEHLTARGVPVLITASANKLSVAEHTMAMMLALAKDLVGYDAAVRAGDWKRRFSLRAVDLAGRTLLIVGFGRIGREVAARARALSMRVLVNDIAMDRIVADRLGCTVVDDVQAAFAEADVVTLHVPLNAQSAGMMTRAAFASMKPGAIFLNIARGGLIDEQALADALRSGHIAAAGVDVFDTEPMPPDHPLADVPNVILTPHSAASTQEGARRMSVDTAENILAAFAGRIEPDNIFNPAYASVRR